MSAWVQFEVDELPEFENRKGYTTYKLADGQALVSNKMFLDRMERGGLCVDAGRPPLFVEIAIGVLNSA